MPSDKAHKLVYLYRYAKNNRLAQVTVFSSWSQWPERSLRARGVHSMTDIASRKMTPLDYEEEHKYRCTSWKYSDWQSLLNDERRLGTSQEFIEELKTFAETHPL